MLSVRNLFRALALGVLVLCAACTMKFDPSAGAKIQTVTLTGFDEPDYAALGYFVLRATSVTPQDSDEFSTLMAKQNLHLGAELKAAIAQALRNDGYQVVDGNSAVPADAVFNVSIRGLRTDAALYASHGGAFEPEFVVITKLTDARTKSTLFQQLYLYADDSIEPIDGSILLRPDEKYAFLTARGLFSDLPRAAEGFRAVEPLVAQSIEAALKKP
jgi:hypothetical protein